MRFWVVALAFGMVGDEPDLEAAVERLDDLAVSQGMTISVVRPWRGPVIVEGLAVQDL